MRYAVLVLLSSLTGGSADGQVSRTQSVPAAVPHAEVMWNAAHDIPIQIRDIASEPLLRTPAAIKSYFAENFGAFYRIQDPDREIRASAIRTDRDGSGTLTLYQVYKNIPVYGVSLKLGLDRDDRLQSVSGKWLPGIDLDVTPAFSGREAADTILHFLRRTHAGPAPLPDSLRLEPDRTVLVIFNPGVWSGRTAPSSLAYRVLVRTQLFFVDAHTGEILFTYSNLQKARARKTYTTTDCYNLPGTLVLEETGPAPGAMPDSVAWNAHRFAGMTYDYFRNTFGRDSYDDAGAAIVSTVHSGVPQDIILYLICCIFDLGCCGCEQANAAWIPSLAQVSYGDGGSRGGTESLAPLANGLDVVAHEISHGVGQYSIYDAWGSPAGLDYTGQPGALNESFADLFGAMVDRDDWLMGEDVAIGYPCGALRNMASPPSCGQPDHMADYDPDGDVHSNSGIPNKVAYLIAAGGVHPRSHIAVQGIGRQAAEQIYYRALTRHLTETSTFLEARAATLLACQELFPGNRAAYATVWDAYAACGICDSSLEGGCAILAAAEDLPPAVLSLSQNYPNPFNPQTVVPFALSQESFVTLKVYNILGQSVATLVNGRRTKGSYEVPWSAPGLPSGVYFCRLTAVPATPDGSGVFVEQIKLILTR